jgi:hypothetical protein
MKRRGFGLFAWLSLAASWGMAADLKVEAIGACDRAGLSEAMKASLGTQGARVLESSGVLCEIWYRKAIPVTASGPTSEYSAIVPGAFAGVIAYSGKAGDYRGQALRPGTYTMRYALLPADGNHMGVSPTTDYFLLSPVDLDGDPDVPIDYDKLLDLSRKAAGTSHPSVLYLVAPAGGGGVRALDGGRYALEATARAVPAGGGAEFPFPIALVLVGHGGE